MPIQGRSLWRRPFAAQPKRSQAQSKDFVGQIGILVDGIVDGVQRVEQRERRRGQSPPLRRGQRVEVLTSSMRRVVVCILAVLTFSTGSAMSATGWSFSFFLSVLANGRTRANKHAPGLSTVLFSPSHSLTHLLEGIQRSKDCPPFERVS